MPIKPERRHLYPPRAEWRRIRQAILARAENRCEWCGVENYAIGYRDDTGAFHETEGMAAEAADQDGEKVIRIVLTIAHLDHDPQHNDPRNLAALCQRCHLGHDHQHHQDNAAATRAEKRRRHAEESGQASLSFSDGGHENMDRA